MDFTVSYETSTCSRCGGCGHYSFNLQHGTICFKCAGSGKMLTKKGLAAKKAFEAKRFELYGKPAIEIKESDFVVIDRKGRKWRKVVAVGFDNTSVKQFNFTTQQYEALERVILYFSNGNSYSVSPTTVLEVFSKEAGEALYEFALKLPSPAASVKVVETQTQTVA